MKKMTLINGNNSVKVFLIKNGHANNTQQYIVRVVKADSVTKTKEAIRRVKFTKKLSNTLDSAIYTMNAEVNNLLEQGYTIFKNN